MLVQNIIVYGACVVAVRACVSFLFCLYIVAFSGVPVCLFKSRGLCCVTPENSIIIKNIVSNMV
jgi:hypothetical protein